MIRSVRDITVMTCVVSTAIISMTSSASAQEEIDRKYEGNPLAIVDVTIVDVATGTLTPHQTVVVRDGKIDHVKHSSEFQTPGWMTEIGGQGKFLIPGLWDAHVHLSFWDEPEQDDDSSTHKPEPDAYRDPLNRLIGWGVTSVRDMGGDLSAIDDWRSRISRGDVIGPTVYRAGPYVDGPKPNDKFRLFVTNADEGDEAAEVLKSKGVDFIKIHSQVPYEALVALARKAKTLKLPLAGHVPYGTTIDHLIDLGIVSIEHTDAFFISRLGSRQGTFDQWNAAFDWHNTAAGQRLLRTMSQTQTWFTPTLAIFDTGWEGTPDPWIQLRQWYRDIVAFAHREGVGLLAGTDLARKTGPVKPGMGLHQELEHMVQVGLSPANALRTATLNPAMALNRDGAVGTIEPGMIADLVLLRGNPLEDISQTQAIEAVILRGELINAERLSTLRGAEQ